MKGDISTRPRDVDFLKSAERGARLVSSFINESQYGRAHIQEETDEFRLVVIINMPATQNVLNSASAFMVCVSALLNLENDRWGCVLRSGQNQVYCPSH